MRLPEAHVETPFVVESPVQADRTAYYRLKRCLDIILAATALLLLSPLLLLIALAIKLDTPGPAFFVQQRVGARRRAGDPAAWEVDTFPLFKFRSMYYNADESLHRAYIKAFAEGQVEAADSPQGGMFKLTGDPRVTRVGRIIRKTSLDELPQLLNVLRGEMSLVGPRPVPTYEVAEYQAQHHKRLATLPGITGLWQVQGRCQVSFEEMIRMDIAYIHSQSLWLDLKILLLTIPAVILGRGAE